MALKTENVVVALGWDKDKTPVLIIGLHPEAFEWVLENKTTHTIDGTRLGVNCKILIFAENSQKECFDTVVQAGGIMTGREFGIK